MAENIPVYAYRNREDYDKTVKIDGMALRVYSKRKFSEIYTRGGYSFVGEIYSGNVQNQAGFLECPTGKLFISRVRSTDTRAFADVGYIEVGENLFVAVMKKAGMPPYLRLLCLFLAIALTAFSTVAIARLCKKPEDVPGESETDEGIRPIPTENLSLSGKVTEGGLPLSGVAVTLYRGDVAVATVLTDTEGGYLFYPVQKGLYNVGVASAAASALEYVQVEKTSVTRDFALTGEKYRAALQCAGENAPAVGVGGLTAEAQKRVCGEKTPVLTLRVRALADADVPAADAALIREKSGETALSFYDFSILFNIYAGAEAESSEEVSETDKPILIVLPYDSRHDVGTYVFRVHGGEAKKFTELSALPTGAGSDGTYYVSTDYVYIYSKYFSLFAVGSASVERVVKGSDSLTYSNRVYLSASTGKLQLLYRHDYDSDADAKVEVFLLGEGTDVLLAESRRVPPGNELTTLGLHTGVSLPSAGTYQAVMRISYYTEGGAIGTRVDIPVTLSVYP